MPTVLAALALLQVACAASASPAADPSDAARAMSECGARVGGSMARNNRPLNGILAAVDRECASEEASLAPFAEEDRQVRQELLLRYLDLGADARRDLPPAWGGTRVRVIH